MPTEMEREPLLNNRLQPESESVGIQYPNIRENEIDRRAVVCIIITVLCERLAYYSILANMILYCTSTLKTSSTEATTINLAFSGSVFIIPVVGGYIADVWVGKFQTILCAGFIYIIGLVIILASSIDYQSLLGHSHSMSTELRHTLFIISLILITIGSGGIRSNIGPLGAQQVECKGQEAVQSFFNWFYWFINIGSVIAHTEVTTVQENFGFCYGYLIPLIVMALGQIAFWIGRKRYYAPSKDGSPYKEVLDVCCTSRCKRFDQAEHSQHRGGKYSKESVQRVRCFSKILPIFGLAIVYWAVFSQTSTTFLLQSERLDLSVESGQVPVPVLHSFDNIAIIMLIPVMEMLIYPLLKKIDKSPSLLQRMGTGMIFAVLSVLAASILEIYRKKDLSVSQIIMGSDFNASSISVFAQIPQFTLFGASEVFTSIGGMEFAYAEAPDVMKGVCMGLFLETAGIGFYFALLVLAIAPDSWFPNEINNGKTEYLFFLLAGLMALNFLFFIYAAISYTRVKKLKSGDSQDSDGQNNLRRESDVNSAERQYDVNC